MKKVLATTAIAFSLIGLTGCNLNMGGNPEQCSIDGTVAPQWVCTGGATMEGGLFAVGSAEKSPLGPSFQRTEATAAARDALSREIKVKVKNMFKQFQATTGIGDEQTAEKATQNVSKQVSANTLAGSKVMKVWISPKGTMYVLVGMPDPKAVQQQVKQATKTSLKNNAALWQKFLAKKADAELDAAVDKEFGGAAGAAQ
jgi:ribosomal protein S20